GEGRRRVAAPLLAVDGEYVEARFPARAACGGGDGLLGRAGGGLGGEGELLHLAAAVLDELQREALRGVRALAGDGPVLERIERLDLLFALADHAQRRALHPAGRKPAAHFLPQQRRQVEAHQIVERAARLLSVDQVE